MDVLPALIVAAVVVLIGGLSWLGRRSEHRDPAHPDRIRMPRFVLWIGVAGLPPMLAILLVAPGSDDPAMTIVPLLMIGALAYLIALYLNWYVVLETDRFTFRSAIGRVHTVRHDDVDRVRLVRQYNATRKILRAADGTRFSINPGTFDVSPLLRALHERGWDLTVARRGPRT